MKYIHYSCCSESINTEWSRQRCATLWVSRSQQPFIALAAAEEKFTIQESAKGATRLEIPAHGGTGHSSRCFAYLSSLSQTKKKRGADIKYQRILVLHRARRARCAHRAQLYKAFATDLAGLQPPGAAKELDDGSCPTGYGGC